MYPDQINGDCMCIETESDTFGNAPNRPRFPLPTAPASVRLGHGHSFLESGRAAWGGLEHPAAPSAPRGRPSQRGRHTPLFFFFKGNLYFLLTLDSLFNNISLTFHPISTYFMRHRAKAPKGSERPPITSDNQLLRGISGPGPPRPPPVGPGSAAPGPAGARHPGPREAAGGAQGRLFLEQTGYWGPF